MYIQTYIGRERPHGGTQGGVLPRRHVLGTLVIYMTPKVLSNWSWIRI